MVAEVIGPATSEQALWTAWARVASGTRSTGIDGISPQQYAACLARHLDALARDLREGSYQAQPYRAMTVRRAGKQRVVHVPTVRDRVAQRAFLEVLTQPLDTHVADAAFAYRRGRSWLDALRRAEHQRRQGLSHVLRADIEAFFASVNCDRPDQRLSHLIADERARGVIRQWLTVPSIERDGRSRVASGLPEGTPIAPLLANVFLGSFDQEMQDLDGTYLRYADDIAVFCEAQAQAVAARVAVQRLLADLGLRLNANKTYVSTFDRGFSFLGWVFFRDGGYPTDGDKSHPYGRTTR